jgi:AraC-like DNA-binding protein
MRETAGRQYGWLLGEQIAARLLTLYTQRFGDLQPILKDAELPSTGDVRASALRGIAPQVLNALCSRAVNGLTAREGRTALGQSDWRVVLYCLTSATTLRDAITRCIDCFESLDGRCGHMSLRPRADGAELRLETRRGVGPAMASAIALYGVAEIHRVLSALIAQPLPLRRICLETADPWFAELDLTRLPSPVTLDAGWTGFVFPVAYLDHPVICAAGELSELARQSFLFQVEDAEGAKQAAVDAVRRLALRALRDRQRLPPFQEVVSTLGASPATLRRRLAAEGTNYREIKDSCRRELGLDLLRRSALPIEEVAARLDFCDADAFRRAFQGWFGTAPSRYRRAAQLRRQAGPQGGSANP